MWNPDWNAAFIHTTWVWNQEIIIKIVIGSFIIYSSNLMEKTTRESSVLLGLLGQLSVFLGGKVFLKAIY